VIPFNWCLPQHLPGFFPIKNNSIFTLFYLSSPRRRLYEPEAEVLSNVTWTGLIQVNFDNVGPSPYIFKKGDLDHDIVT
jgi:hypothetical protein